MSGTTTFTWLGGQDVNGANNWITPLDWTVGGVAATTFPNGATAAAVVNTDNGSQDTIISGGQVISLASLSIGNPAAPGVQGGHVIVGGSKAGGVGADGIGTLNVAGAITVTSTNTGGGLVGGVGSTITAQTMTINGGPSVLVGGGGTYTMAGGIINNGEILADGGFFNLGQLTVSTTTITGTGLLAVSGNSSFELNAATAQQLQATTTAGQTAAFLFDQPNAVTGPLNWTDSANSALDLFFKNETPTNIVFDAGSHSLVITFSDNTTKNIAFTTSSGTVPIAVVPSTIAGYGEVALGVAAAPPPPPPGTVALQGTHDQYLIADNNGALFVQDTVPGRDGTQNLPGDNLMRFADGTGVFDPTGTAEDVARLYLTALSRAPDVSGLAAWTGAVDLGHQPLSFVADQFATSAEFNQHYGALTDDAFVQQLYLNALGRPADPGGEQTWDNLLASGAGRGAVVQAFANSQEGKIHMLGTTGDANGGEVFRLYQTAFNRTPDPVGADTWSTLLASGATPQQVAQDFVASQEFQNIYGGLDNSGFVSTLYTNALHRPGDPTGLAAWTGALNAGMSKADVVLAFSDSVESRLDTAGATHANWVFTPTA